jgi:hypothetical protein
MTSQRVDRTGKEAKRKDWGKKEEIGDFLSTDPIKQKPANIIKTMMLEEQEEVRSMFPLHVPKQKLLKVLLTYHMTEITHLSLCSHNSDVQ